MATENGQDTIDDICKKIRDAGIPCLADHIKSAWNRERAEIEADALAVGGVVEAAQHRPGNAAAMREALVVVRKDLWEMMGSSSDSFRERKACDMARRIRAALSAPARNCERFDNWDDAEAEYQRLVEEGKVEDGTWCEWLWNIAKEGGTR